MFNYVVLISTLQVIGDLVCFGLALSYVLSKNKLNKLFFILNSIAFFAAIFVDSYYNYTFRIAHANILHSISTIIILPLLIFQLSQVINWCRLVGMNKKSLLSLNNLPYLFFSIIVISVLIYYFTTGSNNLSQSTILYNSFSIILDMLIWFFGILCLARTTSLSIVFLTFGSLMIVSADLTSRCLFMFEIDKVASTEWVHIVWMTGVWIMAIGFLLCKTKREFNFCAPNSIQASCNAWTSTTALIAFLIGIIFLSFFKTASFLDLHVALWDVPIALMFMMLSSCLLGNWFSNFILLPVSNYINRIKLFKSEETVEQSSKKQTHIYEFIVLDEFIDESLKFHKETLDTELKISAQVAHDIRSPLLSLEVFNKRVPSSVSEPLRISLRDAIEDIRDITNNLDKKAREQVEKDKTRTQISVLLDYVISDRRLAYSDHDIEIIEKLESDSDNLFVRVIPSEIKRILMNIINNAHESIVPEKGTIIVSCYRKDDDAIVTIEDNGRGISEETIKQIFKHGFTTKQNGSGLGLYHAKETLAKWDGTIALNKGSSNGCLITITLPLAKPPSWFIDRLSILENSTVICVDDSVSIFNAWKARLEPFNGSIQLKHCKNQNALTEALLKQNKPCTYLIDFEFHGQDYTGIDLVKQILPVMKSQDRIFMVTSRANDKNIHAFCKEVGIKMIPKFFALRIPIFLTKPVELLHDKN